MSGRRPPKKTPDERLRDRVAQLEGLVESQAAQVEGLAQTNANLNAALVQATTKPARSFRGRTIEHGPLKVTIRPVEQIPDAEIYLKQDGDVLVILIGDAARLARGGVRGDWAVPTSAPVGIVAPAPTPDAAPVGNGLVARPLTQQHIAHMQRMTDVNQAIDYGAQFGLDAEASASLAIGAADLTTGLVPTELLAGPPNVMLQPQKDPKSEGGFQLRDEVTAANAREIGWSGVGQRPPGWVDPHAPPKETPTN
jgi:hypothetical protein